jgi:ABC-type antimicrobial peptide transport system permease subunit
VRLRQTNFAVLRALGAASRQITGQLVWEMAIMLAIAFLLGLLFGTLLVATSVSSLVFTSSLPSSLVDLSNTALYTLQQVIPVTIVVPPSLGLALLVLVALCLLAVISMSRLARRPLLAEALLVDDD